LSTPNASGRSKLCWTSQKESIQRKNPCTPRGLLTRIGWQLDVPRHLKKQVLTRRVTSPPKLHN